MREAWSTEEKVIHLKQLMDKSQAMRTPDQIQTVMNTISNRIIPTPPQEPIGDSRHKNLDPRIFHIHSKTPDPMRPSNMSKELLQASYGQIYTTPESRMKRIICTIYIYIYI